MEEPRYHDLDDLIGTWEEDPEFDRAIEAQRQIDEELWKDVESAGDPPDIARGRES